MYFTGALPSPLGKALWNLIILNFDLLAYNVIGSYLRASYACEAGSVLVAFVRVCVCVRVCVSTENWTTSTGQKLT